MESEASVLCASGVRTEPQRGQITIVPLCSWSEPVTDPAGVTEQTGIVANEVSAGVVELTKVADEGDVRQWRFLFREAIFIVTHRPLHRSSTTPSVLYGSYIAFWHFPAADSLFH